MESIKSLPKKASKHPVAACAIGGALVMGSYLAYTRLPEDNWLKSKIRGGNLDKEIRDATDATRGFVDSTSNAVDAATETGSRAIETGKESYKKMVDSIKGQEKK